MIGCRVLACTFGLYPPLNGDISSENGPHQNWLSICLSGELGYSKTFFFYTLTVTNAYFDCGEFLKTQFSHANWRLVENIENFQKIITIKQKFTTCTY